MPTTLYNLMRSHPLIKWDEVAQKVGLSFEQLQKHSLIGLHNEEELRNKLSEELHGYIFVRKYFHIYPIVPDDFYGKIADVFRPTDDIKIPTTDGSVLQQKHGVSKARHSLAARLDRWRRSVVGILIEKGLLDPEKIEKSEIVTEHGFSEIRLRNLLLDNNSKTSLEIKEDLYLILLLCQFLEVDIEFG